MAAQTAASIQQSRQQTATELPKDALRQPRKLLLPRRRSAPTTPALILKSPVLPAGTVEAEVWAAPAWAVLQQEVAWAG